MFGRKVKHEAQVVRTEREGVATEEPQDAETLVRKTLDTLDQSLAVRREAREKTARFVGSMRPFAAKR